MANSTTKKDKYFGELRIYKPNAKKMGAASKIQLKIRNSGKYPEPLLFWVAAPEKPSENENSAFHWNDKNREVTMKLGEPDIASILALLTGKRESIKLYHQKNETDSTTLTLQYMPPSESGGKKYPDKFAFRISTKIGKNEPIVISHFVSIEEAEIMRVLMESAVRIFYGWQ